MLNHMLPEQTFVPCEYLFGEFLDKAGLTWGHVDPPSSSIFWLTGTRTSRCWKPVNTTIGRTVTKRVSGGIGPETDRLCRPPSWNIFQIPGTTLSGPRSWSSCQKRRHTFIKKRAPRIQRKRMIKN